jgi:basic amino acid/polyamine antiporter, APA family
MTQPQKYSFTVAVTVVIANMIGTGVFTSLGYQVGPIPSGFAILMLWLVGGVVSLCGAFCYAEIATSLKKSGGEYLFLSKLFHPALGFLSGWISLLVGFAGAISAVAIAIGEYSNDLLGLPVQLVAIASIVIISGIHLFGVKTGGIAQNILTGLKLSLITFFCLAPLFFSPFGDQGVSGISFLPQPGDWDLITSAGWAISLVFVVYAYSGWNASAYIAGNLENPEKNIPRSLIVGTLVVTLVYLALNAMFLNTSTFAELENQNDIGNVVAIKLFGTTTGLVFSGLFSFALLSTLSAMTIAGPRVAEAMGDDYPILNSLTIKNRFQMPYLAILFQAGWSIVLVMLSDFKEIIQYISVSLSWFTLFTVIGGFILRSRTPKEERQFSIPLYPIPPIIFIICTLWMIYYVTANEPKIILYSLGTVAIGLTLYFFAAKKK